MNIFDFGLPALEAVTYPGLLNTFINYGAGLPNCGYYKDQFGIVYLMGMIAPGISGQSVFILPAGYRPLGIRGFSIFHGGGDPTLDAWVQIQANGNVNCGWAGAVPQMALDGVMFRAGT